MKSTILLAAGLALILLSGCAQLSGPSPLDRFAQLDRRYVGDKPVWALDEIESKSYEAALTPLADGWQRQKTAAGEAADLSSWRLSTLAANRSMIRSIATRSLVNPTDEDCRETGYLKMAIASSETAIEQLKIVQSQGATLNQTYGEAPGGILLDNATTTMLLEDTQQRHADLKQIEKYACLKQYPA